MKHIFTTLFLLIAIATHAAPQNTANPDDLGAFKELQETRLNAHKELQQKDLENVRQELKSLDKRVDDQVASMGLSVDRFGVLLTWISTSITVILFIGGFIGYHNAKAEAREVARETSEKTAETTAEKWILANTKKLEEEINSIRLMTSALTKDALDAKNAINESRQDVENTAESVKQAMRDVQPSINRVSQAEPAREITESQAKIKKYADALKNKPENSYSFNDWSALGYAAYADKKLEDAAYYWRKASEFSGASDIEIARVLCNRGVVQGELKQFQAAIETCDKLIQRYGEDPTPALREQVAKALLNKGVAQVELKQFDEGAKTFDLVINKYSNDSALVSRVQVAKALLNKGVAQVELKQFEAAIKIYNKLIRHYGEDPAPALREQVATALTVKAAVQATLQQFDEVIETCNEVTNRYGKYSEPELRRQVVMALLHKGSAESVLGLIDSAKKTYGLIINGYGADFPDDAQLAQRLKDGLP